MIQFNKIAKIYNRKYVLKDINLSFKKNKTHVFIGSSGSGKTTLLKLLAGIITPDQGELQVFGHEDLRSKDYLSKLGYVVQEGGLFPHLSARKNILLSLKNSPMKPKEKNEALIHFTRLVHLNEYLLDKYPHELSGGQKQRVGLIRALIRNPEILLLDEPLGALDPIVRADLQTELKDIFQSLNKTVFFVTHDMNEGAFFGDSITLLDNGLVIQNGTFEELVRKPKNDFVTKFIKSQLSHRLVQELAHAP